MITKTRCVPHIACLACCLAHQSCGVVESFAFTSTPLVAIQQSQHQRRQSVTSMHPPPLQTNHIHPPSCIHPQSSLSPRFCKERQQPHRIRITQAHQHYQLRHVSRLAPGTRYCEHHEGCRWGATGLEGKRRGGDKESLRVAGEEHEGDSIHAVHENETYEERKSGLDVCTGRCWGSRGRDAADRESQQGRQEG